MKRVAPWLGALFLALSAGSLAHAQTQVKDPADLLPAQTVACIEFRQPDKLAREMGLLVKGSSFEDLPATMARLRARLPKNDDYSYWWNVSNIGQMGIFVSPEMIAEFSHFQGGVLAVTGFSKDKGPLWVGVLLPGESNLPPLFMRAMLSLDRGYKSEGETEGVTVYSEHHMIYEAPVPPSKDQPYREPQPREVQGISMALVQGMLVFGATPDQVRDVIRRSKGKSNDPSLSSLRAFKDASKLRDRPGIFAYADMDILASQMDEAAKTMGPGDKAAWEQFKAVVNPRAFRAATASLTLDNGNLQLSAQIKTVPGQTSALLDLLPDKKADPQIFQYVPRDSVVTVSLGVEDGEKRWTKMVALLDALAKIGGAEEADRPSSKIKEAQDRQKIDFGKELFAKVKGVAVCGVPGKRDLSPLLVIQATDATAARRMVGIGLPELTNVGAKEAVMPKKQELDGQIIYAAPLRFLGPQEVFFGNQGDVVILGYDAKSVAAALKDGSKKEGLSSQAKVATALKETEGSIAVGIGSFGGMSDQYFRNLELTPSSRYSTDYFPPEKGGPDKVPVRPEPKFSPRAEKSLKELATLFEPMPAMTLSVDRKGDMIVFEARQMGLKTISIKLIDFWVDTTFQRGLEQAEEEQKRRNERNREQEKFEKERN